MRQRLRLWRRFESSRRSDRGRCRLIFKVGQIVNGELAEMPRPIAVDLFCGAGGMSLGFHRAGFDVRVAIDVDQRNVTTYQENFPGAQVLQADMNTLEPDRIAQHLPKRATVDVVFGGPPCQGFSLIGKRAPNDERNKLIFAFARILRDIRPKFFVLENVPGLRSGTMATQLERFIRLVRKFGYQVHTPSILDSLNFGVPQRRVRLFIIGALNGQAVPALPAPLGARVTVWDAISDLPEVSEYPELLESDRYNGVLAMPSSQYAEALSDRDSRVKWQRQGLGGCRRTQHSEKVVKRFEATHPGSMESVSRFHRLSGAGISPTLRAGTGPDNGSHTAPRPIHPIAPRCITTREAARLHSFPDWFEFHETKWHGFKQVGNSVPPLLAYAVASQLKLSL